MIEATAKIQLTKKQKRALEYLLDSEIIELLYGGGAGGGKTRLMCIFAIFISLRFDAIRGMIGRESLKGLKESTLLTFFDVAMDMGLQDKRDYVYNQQESSITFLQTGSVIHLKELGWMPSDPNYDRLGSTEYTWAAIDEANQVRQKAKNIVRSRLRYKLKVNGLTPKLLLTCNPSKGYLYTEFYQPHKQNKLIKSKMFLPALVTDNPFIDPFYIENLRGLDIETQERLLHGNWEYDDDPSALMRYEALLDMFSNIVDVERDAAGEVKSNKKFIICDVARFGNDKTVVSYWEGLSVRRIAVYAKLPTVPDPLDPKKRSVAGILNEWRELYKVPLSQVLADEDGVGGGVVDYLHCRGFQGGRKPFPMPSNRKILQNFNNLRAQCCFKLAELVNTHKISVAIENVDLKDGIIQELEQIKAKDHDKDGKLQIIGKDEIKDKIGHSPDLADNFMMRMFFEFASVPTVYSIDPSTDAKSNAFLMGN